MKSHLAKGSNYRPACMQVLGLLPPYSVEDVKRAYRHLAKTAHPDAGGNAESFAALHDAYAQALNLARFHESRRNWMADSVERYVQRSELIAKLESFGGRCLLQRPEIYLADYGPDFAHILCEISATYLTSSSQADAALEFLSRQPAFEESSLVDLSFSSITDDGLQRLACTNLMGLDLRCTRITASGLKGVLKLPKLEWLHIGQTRIGIWGRMRLRQTHPHLDIVTDLDSDQPDYDSPQYRQAKLMQRLAAATE